MATEKIYKNIDGQGNELQNWSGEKLAADPTGAGLFQGRQWFNTTDGVARYYDGTNIQTIATIEDLASIGGFAGVHDASGGALPTTGTGTGNSIVAGDYYRVSVAGTITGIGGDDVLEVGDLIYALSDGASTSADFTAVQTNVNLSGNLAQVEEVTLATLTANTSTAIPTTFTNVYSIESYDSANEKISLCIAGTTAAPTAESSSTLTNVKFRIVGN